MADTAKRSPSPLGAPLDGGAPDSRVPAAPIGEMVPEVYRELREIAHRHLMRGRPYDGRDGTLATTALVHEAYLKLAGAAPERWQDHPHFLATAAIAMRQILVDRARAQATAKRGGPHANVTLDEEAIVVANDPEALIELDDALRKLAEAAPRLARVVECRFYGGMSEEEIALALGVTPRTVQRDWLKARMLLRRSLGG